MDALILADGDGPTRDELDRAWPGWDDAIGLVIAADGGAHLAGPLGVRLDRWVGDGDSVGAQELQRLEAAGIPVEKARPDKDESDTELAVRAALREGADGIVIVGGLGGGRIDHTLANIGLLAMPELDERAAAIVDGRSRLTLIRAPTRTGDIVDRPLPGRIGDLVSLLPVGPGVEGVTTRGLEYPLIDEPVPMGGARGLSNVRRESDAGVLVRAGCLLVVESPATL